MENAATQVVKKLVTAGYIAYFAGGWVRDHLLQLPPSDVDIVTNASPEVIFDLFPQTIPVGLAFGVVLVCMEGMQFEVSTFRKDIDYVDGRRPSKVELSCPEEDAKRRDFTINGMFFDPLTKVVHDFVQGTIDLERGVVRTIGNPHDRFREDRLRMIRAVRFASRFGFGIDLETQLAIQENAATLYPSVAQERVWQEFNKMCAYPHFDHALIEMHRLQLLQAIFPALQGVHLNEIKKYLISFSHMPAGCPLILHLMQLFPRASEQMRQEIGQSLKIARRDSLLITYYTKVERLISREEEAQNPFDVVEWVQCAAQPDWQLCLEVLTAGYLAEQRKAFFEKQAARREAFLPHIERTQQKRFLVTAQMLQDLGVPPGKRLGDLLKQSEIMALRLNCLDPEEVIRQLKENLWT